MEAIQRQSLLEYLEKAITLETDIATQEQLITEYQEIVRQKQPSFVEKPLPPEPQQVIDNHEQVKMAISMTLVLVGCITIFMHNTVLTLLIFAIATVLFVNCFYTPILDAEYKERYAAYEKRKQRVVEENKKHQARCQEDARLLTQTANETQQEMLQHLRQTKETAGQFYAAKDIIYPKYRTLSALTSIYEYFITGRCDELTGPNGAYNLYEDEMRKDMVISQLSAVLANLEAIKQNQYMLYQKACEIQHTTQQVAWELNQIKGYTIQLTALTALNTYYTGLIERNTRISMWCDI